MKYFWKPRPGNPNTDSHRRYDIGVRFPSPKIHNTIANFFPIVVLFVASHISFIFAILFAALHYTFGRRRIFRCQIASDLFQVGIRAV